MRFARHVSRIMLLAVSISAGLALLVSIPCFTFGAMFLGSAALRIWLMTRPRDQH